MLRARFIPTLLLRGQGLYKTVKFKNETYVGDPINAVRIFNDKAVDELILLDIMATRGGGGAEPGAYWRHRQRGFHSAVLRRGREQAGALRATFPPRH
jgi:hypothetical protein